MLQRASLGDSNGSATLIYDGSRLMDWPLRTPESHSRSPVRKCSGCPC